MSENKTTGRKPGFNTKEGVQGFVEATPIKATVPTPAPRFPNGTLVTAANRGLEGGTWEEQYRQFNSALEVKKQNDIFESDYLRTKTTLESSLDVFEKNTYPDSGYELSSQDEAEITRIRKEFWGNHKDYVDSTNAFLLSLSEDRKTKIERLNDLGESDVADALDETLKVQENVVISNRDKVQQEVLRVLKENLNAFDEAFDAATTHSEQSESDETWELGLRLQLAKKELKDFTDSLN